MSDPKLGVYEKFKVERTDGKSAPGQKHDGCDYFVLDLTHDEFATAALRAYARACREKYPRLAADLLAKVGEIDDCQLDDPATVAGVKRMVRGLHPDPWRPLARPFAGVPSPPAPPAAACECGGRKVVAGPCDCIGVPPGFSCLVYHEVPCPACAKGAAS